jgi:DNA-binding transcriptional LysR family regulator
MARTLDAGRPRKRITAAGLNIRALEAFVAVVDAGSITRAAQRLGLTQPAVSIALRELESSLGSLLIDRDLRPVRPTRAGMVLYRRASRLLADVEGLRAAVQTASAETLPSIRLGLVVSVTATGAPLIKALQDVADEVQVLSGLTPELGRALLAREVDLLITSDAMEDAEGLERHVILREPFVIALPMHAEQRLKGESLAAIAQRMPLVRYTTHSIIGKQIDRHLRRCGIEIPNRLELDSSNSVLNMVAAGLGWAITTPLCLAQSGFDQASVAVHPLPQPSLARTLFLLNRRGEVQGASERVRAIVINQLRGLLTAAYERSHPWMLKDVGFG